MDIRRTGWIVTRYEDFVDVSPQDDPREHAVGDECWCIPEIWQEEDTLPMVAHNSDDKRELGETDYWQETYMEG